MKAAVLHALGQPPRWEEFPDPIAQVNEHLVEVRAASLKPIDKLIAQGGHYSEQGQLPCIVGVDGVGLLADGQRVYTGGARHPYGMMAQQTVVSKWWTAPVPDALDDITAAAIPNPALSSWVPLVHRAKLQPGETVLILGATGVSGKLAIQIAKLLGAGRVIAAGRNKTMLSTLGQYGADATIALEESMEALIDALSVEVAHHPIDVVLDYLWGPPTEALLRALMGRSLHGTAHRTRLIEIGEMASPVLYLKANLLRGSGVELYGSGGGNLPKDVVGRIVPELMDRAAKGELQMDTQSIALSEVEQVWQTSSSEGKRLVLIP